MNVKWLIRSQSVVTLAAGMIYPYYLLFLKNLGNSYSKYGLAFAVFTISSAALAQLIAPRVDRFGRGMLIASSLGMMLCMLAFPWIGSYVWVLALQVVMGGCNAMQRMSERVLLADGTREGARGSAIGSYHFWTSAATGFAALLGGMLIDWLTIDALFYVSGLLYGVSAWMMLRHRSAGAG